MTRKSKTADAPDQPSSPSKPASPGKSSSKKSSAKDPRSREEKFADSIRTSAGRETVEAFVVAFVLALLFRAFVAEAFVIPTGSMAPTLMGAHKDIFCDQCQHRFQVGASKERRKQLQDDTVVGGICPNCRYINSLDLAENGGHKTFNGDRILVSKFAYTVSDPERWDVIVFKFPGNPKQNYIKRLVGLPGETLTLQYGDVYVASESEGLPSTILRKPADKLLAMRHHVYDTDQQSPLLIKSGYPSRIQPWKANAAEPPTDSWKVDRSESGLTATVQPSNAGDTHWLRYFHRWPSDVQWETAGQGGPLNMIDPYSSRLITDFYAYDCYITVPSDEVYRESPSNARWSGTPEFRSDFVSGGSLSQFGPRIRFGDRDLADDGLHWVGDLILESEIQPSADCQELLLELVEAGVQYRCQIDLASGKAELQILDGESRREFSGDGTRAASVTGSTSARAGRDVSVRFSNCDDQLLLWIDEELVQFDGPTTYDSKEYRPDDENFPRYAASEHPMDASPVGIAVRGGPATVERIKIDRDKYYVASDNSSFGIFDYDLNEFYQITQQNISLRDIQLVMARPDLWSEFPAWQTRRKVVFELGEDQFFPMGDNSPESLDARCWAGTKRVERLPDRFRDQAYAFADASYVPRDLLVGKALMVFWPHPWNSPVPFTPNFNRFRLIR